ncbi:MAG: helix-turn-helix transcriptional regulator [Rhodospirillales bacterium]|nr:helix-turn-helix transcriptional regulator [Rhodospirillales bacterium]MCB9996387.1 helix-turn-helix transcriptional regulator [Rhodospirillales bacterium]
MAIEKEIGKRIVGIRKKHKMTQEDLAGLAELDRSYLSEIENGYKNISVNTLIRIADALKVKASVLLGE